MGADPAGGFLIEMSRAVIIIGAPITRRQAMDLISKVPDGTRVEFRSSPRSLPQNDKLWPMLTQIAAQVTWIDNKGASIRMTPDQWKLMLLDALNTEAQLVPSIDGGHMVNIGRASSRLTKQQFAEFLEIIYAFGAQHGVEFKQ